MTYENKYSHSSQFFNPLFCLLFAVNNANNSYTINIPYFQLYIPQKFYIVLEVFIVTPFSKDLHLSSQIDKVETLVNLEVVLFESLFLLLLLLQEKLVTEGKQNDVKTICSMEFRDPYVIQLLVEDECRKMLEKYGRGKVEVYQIKGKFRYCSMFNRNYNT